MKINRINTYQLAKSCKNILLTTPFLFFSSKVSSLENSPQKDVFISEDYIENVYNNDTLNVSPALKVANDTVYPALVVDKSERKIYSYNLDAYLDTVYNVAIGSDLSPTKAGVRVITSIEKYPYSSAPKETKRNKTPDVYGSRVLTLGVIDEATGDNIGYNGQFIHGTNKPESIGKKASLGCIRMNNDDIKNLSERVYVGQYVLIKE